jgi:cytochrome c oxidase subunit 2
MNSSSISIAMTLKTAIDCVAGIGVGVLIIAGFAAAPPAETDRQHGEPRVIEVLAKRFEFEPSRIEVEEGETVRLTVRSADGMHGVGIKKFKIAEEVPRGGVPVTIEFTATAVGEFDIMCSQFCGKGHNGMKGKLVVRAREGGRR